MSGRTVPRFVPVGLLAVALAAPAVAQEGGFQNPRNSDPAPTSRPVAPMPRAKASPRLRDVYGLRTGLAAKPEPWVETPASTPLRTKIKINHDIYTHSNGGFSTPINSEEPAPIPGSDTLFFNGSEFMMGSSRTERYVAPALVIGARGLERAALPTSVPQLAQCQHVQANTGVFVIRIGEAGGSSLVMHDEPQLPPCESMTWTFPIQNVVKYEYKFEAKAADAASFASAKTNAPANALSGTWYRELPGMVISATFTNDELKLCMAQAADGDTATFTITAHYTLTKDGLVYGAVTGTDADVKRNPTKTNAAQVNADWSEVSASLQALVDTPFSFRTKMTSAGLMVSGLKCGSPLSRGETDILGGMFKFAKDGRVPAPVPLNTDTSTPDVSLGSALGTAVGAATGKIGPAPQAGPCPAECPRVGIDFNFNPPVMIPPKPVGDACTPPARPVMPPAAVGTPLRPVCDTAVPDTMKSLVSEAFGQMLRQSGGSCVGEGMTLPTPRYLEHYPQYFAPDPAFPLPRELAKQEETESAVRRAAATTAAPMIPIASTEPTAKRGVVGTWYRDVAGKQCVVKVSPDHLTFTVHDAIEEDGKVSTASLVITADYHMARDGMTAVGLITSVDVSFEGEFMREDLKPFFEMLGELQKVLEDKPFALTFRPYGDSLVIGNVRMLTVSDRMDVQPAGYMAGRYKSASDKLPKPKPTKVTDPALRPAPDLPGKPSAVPSLAIPPASAYPQPYTQPGGVYPQPYNPQPAPTGDLLPPQSLPAPRIVPSSGSQPAAPQSNPPLMKQPTPPDLSSFEKKPIATEMTDKAKETVPAMSEPAMPEVQSALTPEAQTTATTKNKAVIPGTLLNTYSSEPNIRMRYIPKPSESLRQIYWEWRQFWFNDQPSHLTPERVHGGIY